MSKLERLQEDYDNCEAENESLRSALAWAAERLSLDDKGFLEKRLDEDIFEGGVTSTDSREEREQVIKILGAIVKHTECLIGAQQIIDRNGNRLPITWYARLDYLQTESRQYEPKHPVMVRIGGHPNVFGPPPKGI